MFRFDLEHVLKSMNEETELKPVSLSEKGEQEVPLFVADSWKTAQSKHIFVSFFLVALILLFFAFLTPDGKSETFSTTKLPVFAASGSFDLKLELTEISPFFQRISIFARFISENFMGKITTNGTCSFVAKYENSIIQSKTVPFESKTFKYTDKSNRINFVELFDSSLIYYDSLDLILHFDSPAKNAVYVEFKIVTASANFTSFDIWCRFSFCLAIFIVLLRNRNYEFSNELPYKRYTLILLFMNMIGDNPLHILSFTYHHNFFFILDYILKSIQEIYNIFYAIWIFSPASKSLFAVFPSIAMLFILFNPKFVIFDSEIIPSSYSYSFNLIHLLTLIIFILSILYIIISSLSDVNNNQDSTRRNVYLVIILLTLFPHYLLYFTPNNKETFNSSPIELMAHYICNNFFALLMLYANLLLPVKSINTYQEPSSLPDDVEFFDSNEDENNQTPET